MKKKHTMIGVSREALTELLMGAGETLREMRLAQLIEHIEVNQIRLFNSVQKGRFYVLFMQTGQLVEVNWLTSGVHKKSVVGQYPTDLTYAEKDKVLYVSETESKSILKLEANTLSPFCIIPVEAQPIAVAFNNLDPALTVAFANRQKLILVAAEREQVYSQLLLNETPTDIVYSQDYTYLYCISYTEFGIGKLLKCDANTLRIRKQIFLPIIPEKIKLDVSGGLKIAVICGVGGLCIVDYEKMKIIGQIDQEEVVDFLIDGKERVLYTIDGKSNVINAFDLITAIEKSTIKTKHPYIGLLKLKL